MLDIIEDTFDETVDAATDFAAELATGAASVLSNMGSSNKQSWVSTLVKVVVAAFVIGAIAVVVRRLVSSDDT